jgi:hypothetical protein
VEETRLLFWTPSAGLTQYLAHGRCSADVFKFLQNISECVSLCSKLHITRKYHSGLCDFIKYACLFFSLAANGTFSGVVDTFFYYNKECCLQ